MKVAVTGATGYIGGRLVEPLLDAGHQVRCIARTPAKLDDAPWRDRVEVARADITDPEAIAAALDGCDAAYFLVHAIGAGPDWQEEEARGARTFRDAAAAAGLRQIIYLGGLGDDDGDLSTHLQSRHRVGHELAVGTVPVTELRAAVIIGSGSASFEMLRHLVDVLPAMVTPRWVETRCQPIAVRDVLHHLVAVLGDDDAVGRVLEVGGPDVVTYKEMMRTYARAAGLPRRLIVPVPLLTPRLSSLWVGLVTPLPPSLARPLIDSLVNDVVVGDHPISAISDHQPISFQRAVELALQKVADLDVVTHWSDARRTWDPAEPMPTDPDWSGGVVYEDAHEIVVEAPPDDVYAAVAGIGGKRGWYGFDWMWTMRGFVDLLFGGVGPRRGRRHPDRLFVGDAVDSFRVETVEPPHLLRLRVEMKLPGEGWLEWKIDPVDDGRRARLTQRARYHPRGLVGRLYWWSLVPFHGVLFKRMLVRIGEAAEGRGSRADAAA